MSVQRTRLWITVNDTFNQKSHSLLSKANLGDIMNLAGDMNAGVCYQSSNEAHLESPLGLDLRRLEKGMLSLSSHHRFSDAPIAGTPPAIRPRRVSSGPKPTIALLDTNS